MHIPSTQVSKFFEIVEQYNTICIFRHENPDGDALGSQNGLKTVLKKLYPKKTIVALGDIGPRLSLFPGMDEVEDSIVANSLAIVLDCSTFDRIADKRITLASFVIKIDHHPIVDSYGDFEIVLPSRASTCEILTELLKESDGIDQESASYLLAGILTDTIRFSVEATTDATLMAGAYLVQRGANVSQLSQMFFSKDLARFENERKLTHHIQYRDGVAWLIISKTMRESLGLSVNEAKLYNNIMSGIREYHIWAIFVEGDEGLYLGSLRSQNMTINEIASQYNGGGHRLACGVRNLTEEDVRKLVSDLMDAYRNFEKLR